MDKNKNKKYEICLYIGFAILFLGYYFYRKYTILSIISFIIGGLLFAITLYKMPLGEVPERRKRKPKDIPDLEDVKDESEINDTEVEIHDDIENNNENKQE